MARNVLVHPDGTEEVLPTHFSRVLPAGSWLRIETPGGGGLGTPSAAVGEPNRDQNQR